MPGVAMDSIAREEFGKERDFLADARPERQQAPSYIVSTTK